MNKEVGRQAHFFKKCLGSATTIPPLAQLRKSREATAKLVHAARKLTGRAARPRRTMFSL